MVSPEEHALTRTYSILVESLEYCAVSVTGSLFTKEMIPKSLRKKVSNDSSAVGDVIDCLIGRIKNDPKEFVDVVEILVQYPTLAIAVKKLKKQYAECGGTLLLPEPEALPLPPEANKPIPLSEPGAKPDPAIVKTEAAKDEADTAGPEPVKMEPEIVPEKPVSTEVQAFNTTMTSDKLCSWLRSNQLPESDCQISLAKGIGGRAFKHLTEEKWSSYGISDVGLIVLRDIMGEICPAVPDPGKREMTTGRSSASNGTVDACAPSLPASALPASARPYLELQLDWGNQGVDRDLVKIAHLMVGWEEKLCSHLGLTDVDVHDIIEKYKGNPELQRKEALRIWKNNQALRATYGNLLELFVRAHHAQCAEVVREIIRKKCENQTTKYPL